MILGIEVCDISQYDSCIFCQWGCVNGSEAVGALAQLPLSNGHFDSERSITPCVLFYPTVDVIMNYQKEFSEVQAVSWAEVS